MTTLAIPLLERCRGSFRLANAKPHIIRYVARDFRCSVCESRIKPKPARPAVLPKIYEPGRVVGVDVIS